MLLFCLLPYGLEQVQVSTKEVEKPLPGLFLSGSTLLTTETMLQTSPYCKLWCTWPSCYTSVVLHDGWQATWAQRGQAAGGEEEQGKDVIHRNITLPLLVLSTCCTGS